MKQVPQPELKGGQHLEVSGVLTSFVKLSFNAICFFSNLSVATGVITLMFRHETAFQRCHPKPVDPGQGHSI